MAERLKRIPDWALFLFIYVVALTIILRYAFCEYTIASDGLREYNNYLLTISNGGWVFIKDSIINSCLMVTVVPAYLQRIFHIDAELLFKVYPSVLYALMPSFVYLIARWELNKGYSLLASGLVLSSFFFAYYPMYGRVGVAFAMLSGMIWALGSRRDKWMIMFAILLIFSHYGTAFIGVYLLLTLLPFYIVRRNFGRDFKVLAGLAVIFLVLVGIWHFGIAQESGRYAVGFVDKVVHFVPTPVQDVDPLSPSALSVEEAPENNWFFSLERRETVVQVAFGKTLPYMSIPQRMEFALSWLVIFLFSWGLLYTLLKKSSQESVLFLSCNLYFLIVLTVAIPHISVYYGVGRVYMMALILLAPMFIIGVRQVADKIRVNGYLLTLTILIPYSLCVSGVMHSFFGIVK